MQITSRGYLLQGDGNGCGDCGGSSAAQPFDLGFRCGAEQYNAARSGEQQIATMALEFVPLALTDQFASVRLLALKSSAPVVLRIDGTPALYSTAAMWPVASLAGLTLLFGVDGTPVSVLFASGDDTAEDCARRINAGAALAGVPRVASVGLSGQVEIRGILTGPQGVLTMPTGTAVAALGLSAVIGAVGGGQDLQVDGLYVQQFTRALGARRIQVSGQATLSVLVAGS